VASGERWIEPLHHEDPRTPRGLRRLLSDRCDPPSQLGDQRRGPIRNAGHCPDLLDSGQDPRQGRGLERQDAARAFQPLHSLLDELVRDGAHVAQLLRQNEVGIEAFQQFLVEDVDAAPRVQRRRDVVVDVAAVACAVTKRAPGHDGQTARRGRKVALVRHAD